LRTQVLVFPELSLTGYELDRASELAFSESDPRLGPLVAAAAASRMALIVGAPVRLAADLYIGAFIIHSSGTVDLYTKQRLGAFPTSVSPNGIVPPAENTIFRPGDRNPLVRFGGESAAVAVCADTGHPEHPAAAAKRGASTYLASMFVIPADFEAETAALQTYAARHSMAVVFSNYGGPSGGLPSAGRSAIWSEQGELVAQLGAAGAGLVVAVPSADGWRGEAVAVPDE
jgi:predicted amidohydrolase